MENKYSSSNVVPFAEVVENKQKDIPKQDDALKRIEKYKSDPETQDKLNKKQAEIKKAEKEKPREGQKRKPNLQERKEKKSSGKGTLAFTETIRAHLENRAYEDPQFAEKYNNSKKTVNDCVTYIINEVKKEKRNAYLPDEIFNKAIHFFDEDLEPGSSVSSVRIITDDTLPKSKEDKTSVKPKVKTEDNSNQTTLF